MDVMVDLLSSSHLIGLPVLGHTLLPQELLQAPFVGLVLLERGELSAREGAPF